MTVKLARFLNFIIDTLIYFILLLAVLYLLRSYVPREYAKWVGTALYFLFYFLFEFFAGRTPGKMLTNTKVISHDDPAVKPSVWQIFFRTLIRIVPIDVLSYLFTDRGLHDMISNTETIRTNN